MIVFNAFIQRIKFQHTAARRRLGNDGKGFRPVGGFQHTAARRRLGCKPGREAVAAKVSTHSRPKAAGQRAARRAATRGSFNTQPPEGGWLSYV